MVLGFWDIAVPIVGAPMAGGPGSPTLAAAVSNAGGLGFVPAGYLTAEQFADDIATARAATTGPLGVNLLVPQPSVADFAQLEYYAEELEDIADHYRVEVGHPEFGDDDDWERKLEVVADVRPELVSFTFGVPPPDIIRRLGALGLLVMVTVTSAYEAGVALAAGADSLIVQGPNAGGHRGTFAPDMEPGTESLHRADRSDRQGPPRCCAGGGRRSEHRRGCRGGIAQGSGGRTGRHRAAAERRSRHQLHLPRRPPSIRNSAIRLSLGHFRVDTPVDWRTSSPDFSTAWRRWVIPRSTR